MFFSGRPEEFWFSNELWTKICKLYLRGSSSVGRAVRSQRTGQRFDPALLQKFIHTDKFLVRGSEFMVHSKIKAKTKI